MFGNWMIRQLIWALALLGSGFIHSQPACFQQANEAYQDERFDEAIALYEKCLAGGEVSATVHYNLGCAYLKQEAFASAILHLEKARKIDEVPGLEENLTLAQSQVDDAIPRFSDFFLIRAYKNVMLGVHPNLWSVLSVIGFILGLFFIYRSWIKGDATLTWGIICVAVGLSGWLLSESSINYRSSQRHGIVMESATLYSGSDDRSEKIREVGEGNKVRLLDSLGSWLKVELPDKEQGWILFESLEEI